MNIFISVIICTHNPSLDYISRVLEALQIQTLSSNLWELLLVDNSSDITLSNEIDLSWHPNSFHIRENNLGLTPARLRGITESQADILIFVDDDNILYPDYLETALRISQDYPFVGAWGGQITPEFEVEPPEWTKSYWWCLAIREFSDDRWSNIPMQNESTPCGAGLCVRRVVAEKYLHLSHQNSDRFNLDRKGSALTSSGDSDLAYTACDIGMGTGQFSKLKLTHLIPAFRLSEEYMSKLLEGLSYSGAILLAIRGSELSLKKKNILQMILQNIRIYKMPRQHRKMYIASQRGYEKALREILETS